MPPFILLTGRFATAAATSPTPAVPATTVATAPRLKRRPGTAHARRTGAGWPRTAALPRQATSPGIRRSLPPVAPASGVPPAAQRPSGSATWPAGPRVLLAFEQARYFTPDYWQRTDGELIDRDGFAAHIEALRQLVAHSEVDVVEALRDGDRIACRHVVSVTRHDGTVSQLEIYLFGELAADGRLRRVDEISRVVTGGEGDARLERAR